MVSGDEHWWKPPVVPIRRSRGGAETLFGYRRAGKLAGHEGGGIEVLGPVVRSDDRHAESLEDSVVFPASRLQDNLAVAVELVEGRPDGFQGLPAGGQASVRRGSFDGHAPKDEPPPILAEVFGGREGVPAVVA